MKNKFILLIAVLVVMHACSGRFEDFRTIEPQVHFRLLQFGEGNAIIGDAFRSQLHVMIRPLGQEVQDYDNTYTFQRLELDALGGGAFAASVARLHEGDSAEYLIGYARFKETLLDEYAVDEIPVHDTTHIRLTLAVEHIWNEAEFEAEQQAAVREGRMEEDRFVEHWIQRQPFALQVRTISGLHVRWLDSLDVPRLQKENVIRVDMIGRFFEGEEFDNTYNSRTSQQFQMGAPGQVVPGIQSVLPLMGYGERVEVFLPSYRAFGTSGSSDKRVPAKTPVRFEVEVREPIAP